MVVVVVVVVEVAQPVASRRHTGGMEEAPCRVQHLAPLLGEVVLILLSCTPQAGPRDNLHNMIRTGL